MEAGPGIEPGDLAYETSEASSSLPPATYRLRPPLKGRPKFLLMCISLLMQ